MKRNQGKKIKPAKPAKKGELKALFTSLQGRNGLFAAISILVVIAIVVILNLAVGLLPSNVLQKDRSSEKI